jgi:general secretion pathway protein G
MASAQRSEGEMNKQQNEKKRTRRFARRLARRAVEGMTLVEIMVVVIIMALIATAVGVAVLPAIGKARKKQALSDAGAINAAATMWIGEHAGECPTIANLLEDGQLDHTKNSKDPWDNDYVITCEDDSVTTKSAGPDKQMGTEDDISL